MNRMVSCINRATGQRTPDICGVQLSGRCCSSTSERFGADSIATTPLLRPHARTRVQDFAGKSYADATDIKLPKYENLSGYQQNLAGNIERYYDYWNRRI
jgi:predicted esterase YcpF (UPF0227 family)